MLETDAQNELSQRLARLVCDIKVPRALQMRLARRGALPAVEEERRKSLRYSALAKTLVEVKVSVVNREAPAKEFAVLRTDLSGEGMGFLHAAQLFPGDLLAVWFPTGKLDCRVTRCVKHNAKCFEIGATFLIGPRSLRWLRAQCGDQVSELA
jgi:hypothetical protein